MPKVSYREGDWVAVPLRDGGYAVGLIARANPKGALLGYFFGPRRSRIPRLHDVSGLRPGDAVLVRTFGHLGIVHGTWPLLGRLDGWERQDWPTPVFVRYEGRAARSTSTTTTTTPTGCSARSRSRQAKPSKHPKTA